MAWIESHQSLSRHRKTIRTAGRLSVDRHKLIGHLHELWWWGLDNVGTDGCLGDMEPLEIAMAAEWDGDAEAFVAALVEGGFLDEEDDGYYLHDWYDYAGKLIERREQERERSRVRRASRRSKENHPKESGSETDGGRRSSDGRPEDDRATTVGTQPNPTQPNRTIPQEQERAGARDDDDGVVGDDSEKWKEFQKLFTQAFGGLPNEVHYTDADSFLKDGMEIEAVNEALRLTALNKARGWSYTRRILQNWLNDEIYTLAQVQEREDGFDARASPDEPDGSPSPINNAIRSARARLAREGGNLHVAQ